MPPTISPPEAILFDLDGTVIDSIELIVRCFQHTVRTHLALEMERAAVLALIGKPLRAELERMAPGRGETLTATYREMQFAEHDSLVSVFAGILEVLHEIRTHLPIGIVTSKARPGTNKALELMPCIAPHFKTIVTDEDVAFHKPHPEPILHAAKEISVHPSRVWYVGDSIFDMQSAAGAGATPIGVTWGVADRETLVPLAAAVIDEPFELLKLLHDAKQRETPLP